MMDAVTVQIAKLELKDGDTLVVMHPKQLCMEQFKMLKAYLERGLPKGVGIKVLDDGMTLAKLSPEERTPVLGRHISQALINALGLPKNLISFELRVVVDEVVSVRCEYCPEQLDGAELQSALAEYELVERPAAKEEQPFDFDAWMSERKEAAHASMLERDKGLSRMDERIGWYRSMGLVSQ